MARARRGRVLQHLLQASLCFVQLLAVFGQDTGASECSRASGLWAVPEGGALLFAMRQVDAARGVGGRRSTHLPWLRWPLPA